MAHMPYKEGINLYTRSTLVPSNQYSYVSFNIYHVYAICIKAIWLGLCHDPETDPGRAATEGEEKQTQAGLGEFNTLFFLNQEDAEAIQ